MRNKLLFVFCVVGTTLLSIFTAQAASLIDLAEKGNLQGIKATIAQGADINAKNKYGVTPLFVAANFGQSETAKFLLGHGANIGNKSKLLRGASNGGLLWLVKKLLDSGVDVNTKGGLMGNTPIHNASLAGRTKVAMFLLSRGADVNAKDKFGASPLSTAAYSGQTDVAKLLLQHGAEVNYISKFGDTPLNVAINHNHTEMVKLLIKHGANVNTKTKLDVTPLEIAISKGHVKIVKLLLGQGANVRRKTKSGVTLLDMAAFKGETEIVKLLLDHGANTNTKNKFGLTSLDMAAHNGQADVVSLLLKKGAIVNQNTYANAKTEQIKGMIKKSLHNTISLFGTPLVLADRSIFRKAIKKTGARDLREESRYWYDKYDSSSLLEGTDILYAGYVLKTGALAIAEYRFPTHMDAHKVVEVREIVESKYGKPNASNGNVKLGSVKYTWHEGSTDIVVRRGWPDTTVFLDYIVKNAKEKMDAEITQNDRQVKQSKLRKQSNAF